MSYIIKKRFRHNGHRYAPGDALPELLKTDSKRLVLLGVIAPEKSEDKSKPVVKGIKPEKPVVKPEKGAEAEAGGGDKLPPDLNPQLAGGE